MEILNLNCKLINFIHHLKERCGLDFKECVELMDGGGKVMDLEAKQQSVALASSVLTERQHYFLLRVCREDDAAGQKYVSLLNPCRHPEITGDKPAGLYIKKGHLSCWSTLTYN
ncbi:hypothetical protein F7725_012403 [Dissostichus mawsoni]|uniref:Uncharacterized protein n=1 Tax=Dissostichus mawsoni TaxID=36200 RepID=A0A7J5YNV1_DISMA|nr:hypothetical protein F7725_012403 [Dissostichus mawsoni]